MLLLHLQTQLQLYRREVKLTVLAERADYDYDFDYVHFKSCSIFTAFKSQ